MSEDAPGVVSGDAMWERGAIVEWLELAAIVSLQRGGQTMAEGGSNQEAMTDATVALQFMQAARRVEAGRHHHKPKAPKA